MRQVQGPGLFTRGSHMADRMAATSAAVQPWAAAAKTLVMKPPSSAGASEMHPDGPRTFHYTHYTTQKGNHIFVSLPGASSATARARSRGSLPGEGVHKSTRQDAAAKRIRGPSPLERRAVMIAD